MSAEVFSWGRYGEGSIDGHQKHGEQEWVEEECIGIGQDLSGQLTIDGRLAEAAGTGDEEKVAERQPMSAAATWLMIT